MGAWFTEHTGIGRLEESDVVLQASLSTVSLVQPIRELIHSRVIATVQIFLGLAELCGQIVGPPKLRLQVRDPSQVCPFLCENYNNILST